MILVTGGTGFIGSHLVESLTENGYDVRCLVRKTSNVSFLKTLDVELTYGDVMNVESLSEAVRGVDIVYHLAGGGNVSSISKKDYMNLRNLNVLGTKNMLKACSKGIQKFILFSSISAIGVIKNVIVNEKTACQPRTPHELAKYESEQVAFMCAEKYGIPLVIIRPAQVYGPRDVKSEILRMCRLIKRHIFPIIGSGDNVVPLIYVENIVHAAILACERESNANEIYIVTDEWHTMNEIVQTIARALNVSVWEMHVPVFAAKISVGMIEYACRMLGITPPFNMKRVESISSNRLYDISKARKELGYAPRVGFEEGIRRTVDWYERHGYL